MSRCMILPSFKRCTSLLASSKLRRLPYQLHELMGSLLTIVRRASSRSETETSSGSKERGPGYQDADKHKAIIVSGFTAIGKTYFAELGRGIDRDVIDLDSSAYSSRKSEFPENYLAAIRKAAEKPCVILISTHPGLADQLDKEGYYVAHVYPDSSADAKKAWLDRLERREEEGKNSRLYKLTDDNWELWFGREQELSRKRQHWTLPNDQYLSDIFGSIKDDFEEFKKCSRQKGKA